MQFVEEWCRIICDAFWEDKTINGFLEVRRQVMYIYKTKNFPVTPQEYFASPKTHAPFLSEICDFCFLPGGHVTVGNLRDASSSVGPVSFVYG